MSIYTFQPVEYVNQKIQINVSLYEYTCIFHLAVYVNQKIQINVSLLFVRPVMHIISARTM